MTDSWRVKWMLDSAPSGARHVCHTYVEDSRGCRDLVAVACHDWDNPDSPVWVCIQTGQALLAHLAACDAEDSASCAKGDDAAAKAAYLLAWDAADAVTVARVLRAGCVSRAACEEAAQAAEDAHRAARAAAAAERETDQATAAADDASAAAERAGEAAQAALAGRKEAEAAVREGGVDPDALAAACGQAAASARERAERDFSALRQERMPRWRITGASAGQFGGDPRRALAAMALEYLGAHV